MPVDSSPIASAVPAAAETRLGLAAASLPIFVRLSELAEHTQNPDPEWAMRELPAAETEVFRRKFARYGSTAGLPPDVRPQFDNDVNVEIENRWRGRRYHQPSDEIYEEWDFGGMIEDAQLAFWVGLVAAEDDALPGWTPGDEFAEIRRQALSALD